MILCGAGLFRGHDVRLSGGEQWTQTKKLILNTGSHHCTVEKRGYLWHIYVGKERRATVVRDLEVTTPMPVPSDSLR